MMRTFIVISLLVLNLQILAPFSAQNNAAIDALNKNTTALLFYQKILGEVFVPFLRSYATQSATDWQNFQTNLDKIFEKCPTTASFWLSSFQVNNVSVTIKDTFLEQLFFVINPLCNSSADAKKAAQKAVVRMLGFAQRDFSSPVKFDNASCLLLSTVPEGKFLMVQNDGKVTLASTVSFLDPKYCFRVSGAGNSATFDLKAFNNRFFDKTLLSFTLVAAGAANGTVFSFVRKEGGLSGYLQAADKKFLKIDAEKCSLADVGTEFRVIQVPSSLYELQSGFVATTADDLDTAVLKLVQATEACVGSATDFAECVTYFKNFCTKAAAIPDWGMAMNKAFIKGVSPASFVKNYFETMLKLKRYALSDALQKDLTDFIAGNVFSAAFELPDIKEGDVFTAASSSAEAGLVCYAAATNNVYLAKGIGELDPNTHVTLSSFKALDLSVSFSVAGKKINIDSSGLIVVGAPEAGVFRLMRAPEVGGFYLFGPENKRLSFDSSYRIGFVAGTPLIFKKVLASKQVLTNLSSDVFVALSDLNKACFDNKSDSAALSSCLQAIITFANQKRAEVSWYTVKGQDSAGQSVTANEYVISILQTVQNNAKTLFTGLTLETNSVLTTILTALADKNVIYPKKIAYLSELSKSPAVTELTENSSLGAGLVEMAGLLVRHNASSLRTTFIALLESLYETSSAKDLKDASAWNAILFNASLTTLNLESIDAGVAAEIVGHLKQTIVPRLLKFGSNLKMNLFVVLCTGLLEKVVKKVVVSSFPVSLTEDLKEIVKTLKDLQKDSSVAADNSAATTAILALDALVNPKKKLTGMKAFSEGAASGGQAEPNPDSDSSSKSGARPGSKPPLGLGKFGGGAGGGI